MKPVITRIFWKRTYLFLEYECDHDIHLSLVPFDRAERSHKIIVHSGSFLLETKQLGPNKYRSKLNITIASGRELLKPGSWAVVPNQDLKEEIEFADDVLLAIEDFSRVFRYGDKEEAYVASFHMTDKPPFLFYLYVNYMITNYHPQRKSIFAVLKRKKPLSSRIRTICILLAKSFLRGYAFILSHLIWKRGKKILFLSQNMDHIRDNMLAVRTRLYERGLDKQFKIDNEFTNIFDHKIRIGYWFKLVWKIASHDYIFVDDYVPIFSFIKPSKKTKVIQLWHAGFGFKLVGYGRFGISGSPRPYESCHRRYTYGIIGNENLKEIYSEVWGIDKDSILATGMPRLEHFLDKDHMGKVMSNFYREYPQLKGKKIVTFAPTYRGGNQFEAHYDYDKIDFDALYDFCKRKNYAVLFGKHHYILQDIPIKEEYRDLIYDMSKYPLNDILYVTDILITDYSSAFYDFLLLERPVLFFVYDKNMYSATRGVHRPIEKVAPGRICLTFEEIMDALENEDYGEKEKANFLVDNCLTNKKIASDQIIDYILLGEDKDD